MSKTKLATTLKALVATTSLCLGMLAFTHSAQAYEVKTAFKSEHFAVNQVILDENESLDGPTQSAIIGDIQTQNRLDKLSQSSTVVFPAGSKGLTGKINTPILGVLTIANFETGKDRIFFNKKLKYSTDAGVYISYDQLLEMINQKTLNNLIPELKKFPVVFTNIPVQATGYDPTTKSFFITSLSDGVIIDLRVDDSVYYPKEQLYKIRKGCKVNALAFIDRLFDNIPLFISGRSAINYIDCSKAPQQNTSMNNQAAPAKATAAR